MHRVSEHPVPSGPLAPRWLAWSLEPQRAGVTSVARLALENAGTATWRSHDGDGIQASFHWLDTLGNPIVWDGPRTALPHAVAPRERVEIQLVVTAPRPSGAYRLAFDLVEEHRFWFEEIGCTPLTIDVDVAPRISARRLGVQIYGGPDPGTAAALKAQSEAVVEEDAIAVAHLVSGAQPAPGWSTVVLDAHAEGWQAVGTAIIPSGRDRALGPWSVEGGRNPRFAQPLLLPSLLDDLEPSEYLGLPAYTGTEGLFDARASITLPPRSDRRRR